MTELNTAFLFEAGKTPNVRLKKELAESLNNFAKMTHCENKTEVFHKYIESLKNNRAVPAEQVLLVKMVACNAFKKDIAVSHCHNLQSVKSFQERECKNCAGLETRGS